MSSIYTPTVHASMLIRFYGSRKEAIDRIAKQLEHPAKYHPKYGYGAGLHPEDIEHHEAVLAELRKLDTPERALSGIPEGSGPAKRVQQSFMGWMPWHTEGNP